VAGRKLFTNASPYDLQVTLVIRRSANPRDQAGTKDFPLQSKQSLWQEYGNNIDIYLNGIKLAGFLRGDLIAQQQIVIDRGSSLDNQLNMKNGVDFGFANNAFTMTTRQVS
jgi:hypothetical protein